MKKVMILFAATALLASCDKDDDDKAKNFDSPWEIYCLNEGQWGRNDASITALNLTTGEKVDDIYFAANGKQLGDVAQDLVYDDDTHTLFVSVSESHYIAKLDNRGRELARYSTTKSDGSPRSLILEDGYLYASLYGDEDNGGWVVRIDTLTMSVRDRVRVGFYPEGMAEKNGILAVCNSGWGTGQTLYFIDLHSFTVQSQVILPYANAQNIVECDDKFYCNTTEYDANWNAVSRIVEVDPQYGATRVIADAFFMEPGINDHLYMVKQETDYSTTPYSYRNTFLVYDPKTGNIQDLTNQLQIQSLGVYGLSVNDAGELFIFVSNPTASGYTNSQILTFSRDLSPKSSTPIFSGILTKKAVFVE